MGYREESLRIHDSGTLTPARGKGVWGFSHIKVDPPALDYLLESEAYPTEKIYLTEDVGYKEQYVLRMQYEEDERIQALMGLET